MRIAISGTHRTGKSTLAEDLTALLRDHILIGEPYHDMAEDGYPFSHPPSLDDFEAQLEHSLVSVTDRAPNVLFDRCPVDFLGYLATHDDAGRFDVDAWLPRVRAAVRTLDWSCSPPSKPSTASCLPRQTMTTARARKWTKSCDESGWTIPSA